MNKYNKMKKIFLLLVFLLATQVNTAQKNLLQSGPMIGRVNKTDVKLWVQTQKSARVSFVYWEENQRVNKKKSESKTTRKEDGFVAQILIDGLKPGTTYRYELLINKKKVNFDFPTTFTTQEVWLFHHPPADFGFAFGSGAYINDPPFDRSGKSYGGNYIIYQKIAEKQPDFMIWGGDNTYLRQNEWDSKSAMIYRYTYDWSIPEKQQLFATMPHYAILDDHDFGPNDSDGSFWNKDTAIEVFNLFWANPKPVSGLKSATYQFSYNDAEFFLLDNRYYRDPNRLTTKKNKTILGKEQLEWLKKALVFSKARFKFVVMGGQFLNTARNYETYSNYGFDNERLEIINFIYKEKLKNVIFLTGDRHLSEISLLDNGKNFPKIWDVTVSPFTSGPNTHGHKELNRLRVPETLIQERNFAILNIKGKGKERFVQVDFYNTNGQLIKSYKIPQDDDFQLNTKKKH